MDFDQLKKAANEIFVIPRPPEEVVHALLEISELLDTSINSIALAFVENIESTLSTLTIPFSYSWNIVHNLHRQRLFLAETIRSKLIDPQEGETEDQLEKRQASTAVSIASRRLREFTESEEGLETLPGEIGWHLLRSIENPDLLVAAQELTRQGVVLTWSAFEVLARDLFIATLNNNPRAVSLLIAPASGKKGFSVPKLDVETLADYDFDLSQNLGTLLSKHEPLNDLTRIKDTYSALFPGRSPLSEALSSRDLWILFQRRNLIVHRRGIVDAKYLDKTGEDKKIGERLLIKPHEIDRHIDSVVAAGTALLSAALPLSND
jgi:hypothetical protein